MFGFFVVAIIATVLLLWYGFSPWLTYIFTGGAKTEKYNFGHGAAIFAGVWAASYVQGSVAKFPLLGGMLRTLVGLVVFALLFVGIPLCIFACRSIAKGAITRQERAQREAQEREQREKDEKRARVAASGHVFPIAEGSGYFRGLGHSAGAQEGEVLCMGASDLAQNILCFGNPGQGKTFLVIDRYVRFLARDRMLGGFVPCAKSNFADDITAAVAAARGTADDVLRIGPGHLRWNVIDGMSAGAAANWLRSYSERRGSSGEGSKWIDAAVSCGKTNALLLEALTANGKTPFVHEFEGGSETYRWNVVSWHQLCNLSKEQWAAFRPAAQEYGQHLVDKGEHRRGEQIALAVKVRDTEFENLANDTRSSVLFNINAVLGPLVTDLDIRHAFATETDIIISDLDRGKWLLFDVDKDKFADTYVALIMLAFEQFQAHVLRRMGKAPSKICFIGDEWHLWCNKRQGEFLAVSRDGGVYGCLATQSLSQLVSGMGGHENSNSILGTVGTMVFLPTQDPETIKYAKTLLDKTDREFTSKSAQRGESSNYTPGQYGGSQGESWSDTTSTNIQQREVVDGQLFRALRNNFDEAKASEGKKLAWAQAIAFVKTQGRMVDDLVVLRQDPELQVRTSAPRLNLEESMPSF